MTTLTVTRVDRCFACLPRTALTILRKRREVCIPRQEHRPRGPVIVHHGYLMQRCVDCGTLVQTKEGQAEQAAFVARSRRIITKPSGAFSIERRNWKDRACRQD